jgi:uncharacterized membrane protein
VEKTEGWYAEIRASQQRRYVYMHLLRQLLNGGIFGCVGSGVVVPCIAWSGVLVVWRDVIQMWASRVGAHWSSVIFLVAVVSVAEVGSQ